MKSAHSGLSCGSFTCVLAPPLPTGDHETVESDMANISLQIHAFEAEIQGGRSIGVRGIPLGTVLFHVHCDRA